MSANLLDGVTPRLVSGTTESDGIWHAQARAAASGVDSYVQYTLSGSTLLPTNQTLHIGLSVRGAEENANAIHVVVAYKDGAGNWNWAWSGAMPLGTEWSRREATVVIPSGMKIVGCSVSSNAAHPELWFTSPTLSYGSPVCLASSAHTPYATQDHLRSEYATKAALKVTSDAVTAEVTERGKLAGRVGTLESTTGTHTSKLEQLATSIKSLVKGESTYTDPDGASATSGIYSLVTQTRDSVTALFGQYTKTADLASTQAVKDAKKAGTDAQAAASAAQSTADSLATLIRADSTGITVGKSADGGVTYPQGRTRQSSDAFEVLDDGGKTLSSFSKDKVRLGVGSSTSEIDMADGHGKIFGYLDPQIADPGDGITELRISSDKFLTLHGANEALLYATPSSTVVEHQNSTHAEINVSSEIDGHTFSSDVRLEATAVDETGSDYNTKSTITMLASDGATLNGAQILTAPTVLFYNESQAFNTAISLSDSAGNYTRLKIFYKSDDSDYCSVEVYHPDGKTVALQIARPTYEYATGAAPVMYVKSKIVKISGATIDTVRVSTYGGGENYLRMQKNLSGGYEMADKVGIIRVEGYKW